MGPKDTRHGEAREATYPATEGDHLIDFVDTITPDTARANSEGGHLPLRLENQNIAIFQIKAPQVSRYT